MAKLVGNLSNLRGRIGDVVYYQKNGVTYAREKGFGPTNKNRSLRQLITKVRWSNTVNVWKGLTKCNLHPVFIDRTEGQTDYNAFMSSNLTKFSIFLSRGIAKSNGCLVAPYDFSRGSLAPINVTRMEGYSVTDISLGGLVISAETTEEELTHAILGNNPGKGYEKGDMLVYYRLRQRITPDTGIPYIEVEEDHFRLGDNRGRKVLNLVRSTGFATKEGRLASGEALTQGGEVWLMVRHNKHNHMVADVSSQTIVCNNPLLKSYVSREALDLAIESYGGVTKKDYMMPDDIMELEIEDMVADNARKLGVDLDAEEDTTEGGADGNTTSDQVLVTVLATPSAGGSVTGGGTYAKGSQVTLRATANSGYSFSRWSDGSTSAQRTVTANNSITYTAEFTQNGGGGSQGGYDSGN